MPRKWPGKQADGSFVMQMTTSPEALAPHLNVNADMGYYVWALASLPPGENAVGASEWCTWPERQQKRAKATGIDEATVRYEQVSVEEMSAGMSEFGKVVAEMHEYTTWPGYDGGQQRLHREGPRQVRCD